MTTTNKQRLTLFINPEIIKQAKVQAIVEELTLTAFVEKVLVKYLPKEIVIKKTENRKGINTFLYHDARNTLIVLFKFFIKVNTHDRNNQRICNK